MLFEGDRKPRGFADMLSPALLSSTETANSTIFIITSVLTMLPASSATRLKSLVFHQAPGWDRPQ
jgi:hypothetical protein